MNHRCETILALRDHSKMMSGKFGDFFDPICPLFLTKMGVKWGYHFLAPFMKLKVKHFFNVTEQAGGVI